MYASMWTDTSNSHKTQPWEPSCAALDPHLGNQSGSVSEPNFAFNSPLWKPSCAAVGANLRRQTLHPKRFCGNQTTLLGLDLRLNICVKSVTVGTRLSCCTPSKHRFGNPRLGFGSQNLLPPTAPLHASTWHASDHPTASSHLSGSTARTMVLSKLLSSSKLLTTDTYPPPTIPPLQIGTLVLKC